MLKNNQPLKDYCNGLILFTSESCNLQCSYCDMATHINKEKHASEAQRVKESLVNGQYLNTIQKAFERLEINPNQIKNLELWGQEPTLTLKEFNIFFPQLYNYCNNLSHILFSTNGVGFIDQSIQFVQVLKTTITKPLTFNIQFSFDGEWATEQNRGINSKIIINNIVKYIKALNSIDLGEFLTVRVSFHNVIDNNIINYYSDKENNEKLLNFLNYFSDLANYFINLNTNKKVVITAFGPALIVPYNATIEEGKNLYSFYQNCEKVGQNIEYKNWKGLPFQLSSKMSDAPFNNTILNFLNHLNNPKGLRKLDIKLLNKLSHKLNCGFNYGCLKIRYDGTLIHCQNALLGLTKEELENNKEGNYQIQYRRLTRNFYPNILTDSDEIIDKYLYQIKLHNEECFPQGFAQVCNLLTLLLQSNQVDEKYNHPREFLKCAYYLTLSTTCPHNALMCSGSLSGKYAGWIRFLCNGFMDVIQSTQTNGEYYETCTR